MVYTALLRGINVGGNNRVEMLRLKKVFISLGFHGVLTYINSGNVIFADEQYDPTKLPEIIEKAIETEFGFAVPTIVRDLKNIQTVTSNLPESWVNDQTMKCDIMFLWEEINNKEILNALSINPKLENVVYVPGAIIWRIDREHVTKGGAIKLIKSDLYKKMTIRNCNTVRKLKLLMEAV